MLTAIASRCDTIVRPGADQERAGAAQKITHDDIQRSGRPTQSDWYQCQMAHYLAQAIEEYPDRGQSGDGPYVEL